MKRILMAFLLIVGCQRHATETRDVDRTDVIELNNCLTYYKDTTTGVCYSGAYGGFNGSIFTYVPCTPEVENVAHKFKSSEK